MIEVLDQKDLNKITTLQPEDWKDIINPFSFYIQNPYCYPVKFIHKKNIVGLGCGIVNGNTSWLAHIIVDKKIRGQGIGSQITEFLIQFLKNKGCDTILLLATKLGESVYRKFGFIEESEYLFMRGDFSEAPFSRKIKPYQKKFINQVLALDHEISGEMRSHLIISQLSSSQIYVSNDKVEGFFLPMLGEGLIYATSYDAGKELLIYKLSNSITKNVLPSTNKSGVTILKDLGFVEYSRCLRMFYGRKIEWQPENIFSRIGGNMG